MSSREKLVDDLYDMIDDELSDEWLTRADRVTMRKEAERLSDEAIANAKAIAFGLRKAKRQKTEKHSLA